MINRKVVRQKRHWKIRKKVSGTELRPRLTVFVSNKHFYAQIIDDEKQHTLVSYSSLHFSSPVGNNIEVAKQVAVQLAKIALKKKITQVVLDRGGFLFHGKIRAFTETLKSEGIKV